MSKSTSDSDDGLTAESRSSTISLSDEELQPLSLAPKGLKYIKRRKTFTALSVEDVYGPKSTEKWVSDATHKRLLIPQLLVDLSRILRKRKASKTSPTVLTTLSKRLESWENRFAAVEDADVKNFASNVEVVGVYYEVQSAVFKEQMKHIEERHMLLAKKAKEGEERIAELEKMLEEEKRKVGEVKGEMAHLGEEMDKKKHEMQNAAEEHAALGDAKLKSLRVHDWVYEP